MNGVHQHLSKLKNNLQRLASENNISHPGVHISTLYYDRDPGNTEFKLYSTNFRNATDLAAKFLGGTQPGSAHITASLKHMQNVHDQEIGLLCISLVLADARYLFDFRHIPNLGCSMLPSELILDTGFTQENKTVMFETDWHQMRPMIKNHFDIGKSSPASALSFEDCILQLRNHLYYKGRLQSRTLTFLSDYLNSYSLVDYKIPVRGPARHEPRSFDGRLLQEKTQALTRPERNKDTTSSDSPYRKK